MYEMDKDLYETATGMDTPQFGGFVFSILRPLPTPGKVQLAVKA